MRVISAADLEAALDAPSLVERLRAVLRSGGASAEGRAYDLPSPDDRPATLTVAPAWQARRAVGVRLSTRFAGNAERDLPAVMGAYLLVSPRTGQPLALIDGPALMARRAAAVSGLASHYLARTDARRLLVLGCGDLASPVIAAQAAIRHLERVLLWDPQPGRAKRLAGRLDARRLPVGWTEDRAEALRGADIVACLPDVDPDAVDESMLGEGAHVDLVALDGEDGARWTGRRPVRRFVEAVPAPEDAGDLGDLARGERPGRQSYRQVTVFRGTGSAVAELAVAHLAFERV